MEMALQDQARSRFLLHRYEVTASLVRTRLLESFHLLSQHTVSPLEEFVASLQNGVKGGAVLTPDHVRCMAAIDRLAQDIKLIMDCYRVVLDPAAGDRGDVGRVQ